MLTGIDLNLFDYDRHNSIYFFAMNADKQIYLRYGGRDAEDANTYLNLDSIELALEAGLRQHELYETGKIVRQALLEPYYPRQIESVQKHVIDRNRCVECHLVTDYFAQDLEKAGKLDKRRVLFPSPDIKRLGIFLDIPKGLVVDRVEGPAEAAGLQSGDVIREFEGAGVLTFGDLQYRWGKLDRDARQATLGISRDGEDQTLTMRLPEEWWYVDTTHRYWTVEPMVYFTTKALDSERREALQLPKDGFAAEVDTVDPLAEALKVHSLQKGDIILAINDATRSPWTKRPELHLKLTVRAGDAAQLRMLRAGRAQEMEVQTYRQYYRKEKTDE